MEDIIICNCCGYVMVYDNRNTLYLKCPCCDTILIDVKVKEEHLDPMVVVDYGVEYKPDEEWMWVKCQGSFGHEQTYWKKR